jgi:hypothetical protein
MTTAYSTLSVLPPELAAMVREHAARHPAERDELTQETALAYFEAVAAAVDVPLAAIFARARSRCRSFARAPVSVRAVSIYDAIGIEDLAADADDDQGDRPGPASWRRRDVVRWLAQERGITARRAQQQVSEALARATQPRVQGELFGGTL